MGSPGKQLRALLKEPSLVVAPGAYDCLSALLIERAGFKAAYLGSMAASATLLGKPDIGFLTRNEYAGLISSVCEVTNIPVIADAEDGYGDVLSMGRTVRDYESAGVAAMHIEDHEFGKHISMDKGGRCVDTDIMVQKVKAAVDARRDADTLIIARTDSLWAYKDMQQSIDRVAAYAEAGADMVFIAALQDIDIARVSAAVNVPIVNTSATSDTLSQAELKAQGLSVLLHFLEPMYAAYQGVSKWLDGLAQGNGHVGLFEQAPAHAEIDKILGIEKYQQLHKKLTQ